MSDHEVPTPGTTPVLRFHAEELNEGVSSILTNLFLYTSRSARVQGTATRVRKALDNGDLALLSIKRQPRCHQCFPLVSEPSRQPGTQHLPAAGTDSPRNYVGDRLPACATATLRQGLVLLVQAETRQREGHGSTCLSGAVAARGAGSRAAVSHGTSRTARSWGGKIIVKRFLRGSCLQRLVVEKADPGVALNQA